MCVFVCMCNDVYLQRKETEEWFDITKTEITCNLTIYNRQYIHENEKHTNANTYIVIFL